MNSLSNISSISAVLIMFSMFLLALVFLLSSYLYIWAHARTLKGKATSSPEICGVCGGDDTNTKSWALGECRKCGAVKGSDGNWH